MTDDQTTVEAWDKAILLSQCRFGLSDAQYPLKESAFAEAVSRKVPCPDGDIGGFFRYGPALRDSFCKKLFVSDNGAPGNKSSKTKFSRGFGYGLCTLGSEGAQCALGVPSGSFIMGH